MNTTHDSFNNAIRRARLRGTGRQDADGARYTPEQLARLAEIRAEWDVAGPSRRVSGPADGGGGRGQRPHSDDMNRLIRAAAGKE